MNDETNEQLRLLCRQYFQLVDLESLRWPDTQVLKRPEVQAWLYGHLFDRDAVPSPPSERYQLRVLKQLISRIESAIEDPQEDVCNPFLDDFQLLFTLLSSRFSRFSSREFHTVLVHIPSTDNDISFYV